MEQHICSMLSCVKPEQLLFALHSCKNFIPYALWFKKVALQYAYGVFSSQHYSFITENHLLSHPQT